MVAFSRLLRERGIPVGPHATIVALEALGVLDITDPAEFYRGLLATLLPGAEWRRVFDALFAEFFGRSLGEIQASRTSSKTGRASREHPVQSDGDATDLEFKHCLMDPEEQNQVGHRGWSPRGRLRSRTLSLSDREALDAVERAIARLRRLLSTRAGNRRQEARAGNLLDFRRSLRRNLFHGGELLSLSWKKRRPGRLELVVLCDVSGSMEYFSSFLMEMLQGLQGLPGRVETFVFSSELERVTLHLRDASFRRSIQQNRPVSVAWSGGTRIGSCLRSFNQWYGVLLRSRTTVLIISDGLDFGDVETLRSELMFLRSRVGQVIWLNPYAGMPGYEPTAKGMAAALPLVDLFAPFGGIEDVFMLQRLLASNMRHK